MNTCVACEDTAMFVVAVAYTQKPAQNFEYPPLVFSCDTHLGVLISQSMILHNSDRWALWTYHGWLHSEKIEHSHEEGGHMTPTEEEAPETEAPETEAPEEGEETPETED